MPIQLGRRHVTQRDYNINRTFGLGWGEPAYGYNYAEKILALFGSSIVSYLPLWELSGTVADDISKNGNNGAYTAVTLNNQGIGDGHSAASFDGSTSFTNIYSAALAAGVNAAEITLMAWAKVANAGVWTDGTARHILRLNRSDTSVIMIRRSSTNNQVQAELRGGAGAVHDINSALSSLAWFHMALTVSESADAMKSYINGQQSGSTVTGLNASGGVLNSAGANIGAQETPPVLVWSGNLAHALLLNRAASPAEIAEAYRMAF